MYDQISAFFQHGDPWRASEAIQTGRPWWDVTKIYDKLVRDAYWEHVDIPVMTFLARSGIDYALTQAMLVEKAQHQDSLKSAAKILAYNLGSFTWPGWQRPGIQLTPADMALGYAAAQFNLRLAIELAKPADKVQMAHWLLGAQELARGNATAALAQFREAVPSDGPGPFHLIEGYIHLARIVLNEASAQADLAAVLDALTARNDDEAKGIREQLDTARRVFASQ